MKILALIQIQNNKKISLGLEDKRLVVDQGDGPQFLSMPYLGNEDQIEKQARKQIFNLFSHNKKINISWIIQPGKGKKQNWFYIVKTEISRRMEGSSFSNLELINSILNNEVLTLIIAGIQSGRKEFIKQNASL